jgi:acyl carrier protein
MVRGWDEGFGGNVDHDTLLVADLGCESIDIVMLVVAIEQAFQRRGLPFDQMLRDGDKYVQDFSVRQLVDFLWRVLN